MFVDDLFTLATNLKDLVEQCATVTDWALESCGVVSFEKSTVTTTPLAPNDELALEEAGTNLRHTTATVHLGTKVNLREFMVGYTHMGTDVAHRIGKTKGILGTMTKKGLKKGAVATLPAITIITTTALSSLTYGLSSPHLTKVDIKAMNNTMAQPLTTLLGLPEIQTPEQATWLLHDTGITPPATLIAINDSTTLLLAREGKTDHISAAILPMDTGLVHAVDKFMKEINTTQAHLAIRKRKERTKFLITRARKAHYESMSTPHSLLSQICEPILTRVETLSTKQERALLGARFFFCHPPTQNCDYCEYDTPHTVEHALCQCTFIPLQNRQNVAITSSSIPNILDGREESPTYDILHHLLAQLSWSPHYYPKA